MPDQIHVHAWRPVSPARRPAHPRGRRPRVVIPPARTAGIPNYPDARSTALVIAVEARPWTSRALCTQTDPELFFSDSADRTRQAKWVPARTHDFPGDSLGKAIPYGVYDITANSGWVNAGTDHDTAAFAVESIRRWWDAAGRSEYPAARRLLITADAGGSNGYRTRAWKTGLAALAAQTGLEITVCHFPPGTSKWNKVEHRLFSHITMNWRGRPLTSHDVVINSIAATTTATGLTVQASLDYCTYPTGVKISNAQMAALPISRHPFHSDWNYTLHPGHGPATTTTAQDQPGRRQPALPELTGLATTGLDELITQLATLRQAQREQQAHGHHSGHKPRSGRPPTFPFPDRVIATILHLRLSLPEETLAHLFSTSRTTIKRTLTEICDLLDQHGHVIEPITGPPDLPTHIPPYAPQTHSSPENNIKSAC